MNNSFGRLLRLTSWGESHGPAIGGVLDGVPAGIALAEADLQKELDRRKPGQSRVSTQRKEPDTVKILSGVFEGTTTGAPIGFIIENVNKNSGHYDAIKDIWRPGHADYTLESKFGIRDHRGGGRSSARETAVRVAAGAIARKIIPEIWITGYTIQIGDIKIENFDETEIENNIVRAPDAAAAVKMIALIDEARKDGDSVGGIVEVIAENAPPGLGAPVYGKLNADIAAAMMGINAVKGVEIGSGFKCASMRGSQHNDPIEMRDGKVAFRTNNAGGILGGISNGDTIIARIAVKPTPSILKDQDAVDMNGFDRKVSVAGRHDPCICPRAVPVAEAMMALVLADHVLMQRTTKI